jgi:hypothetical protein
LNRKLTVVIAVPVTFHRLTVIADVISRVTLEGAVEWQYQKTTADNAVRKVKGVMG